MAYSNSSVLNGWHPGESLMQQKLGYDQAPGLDQMWRYIYANMTEQQRIFHTSNLHFLPIVTLDELGRPWGSILASGDGKIGWIKSGPLGKSELKMKPRLWKGDPLWDTVGTFKEDESDEKAVLFAGIGVEVSTRRRNKMAGRIKAFERDEKGQVTLIAHINESTGYIAIPNPSHNCSLFSSQKLSQVHCCPFGRAAPRHPSRFGA
jgi:hypothetical protein